MIATIINAVLIVIGTAIGLMMRKGFSEKAKDTVFTATGVISLVIGFSMAIGGSHILALALSLIIGGLVGTAMDIEGAIFRFGEWLRVRFTPKSKASPEAASVAASGDAADAATGIASEGTREVTNEGTSSFAFGFLNASVLFCVGAMALVGSFKAGAEGDYDLILTKSVMDGVVAIMFAGAMGIGVGFSAISVLVYQGALTLLAVQIKPYVSAVMLTELSAVGGALIVMIGINLLGLRKIRTGDFLPALAVIVGLVFLFDYIPFL
jgi:hypothetical protein